mmetsp:Transcript_337/g.689  ORF Transcript_337/g.689 Transcript_337/m.689 type:complete len:242 (-) Transcript_337:586-1311(-)
MRRRSFGPCELRPTNHDEEVCVQWNRTHQKNQYTDTASAVSAETIWARPRQGRRLLRARVHWRRARQRRIIAARVGTSTDLPVHAYCRNRSAGDSKCLIAQPTVGKVGRFRVCRAEPKARLVQGPCVGTAGAIGRSILIRLVVHPAKHRCGRYFFFEVCKWMWGWRQVLSKVDLTVALLAARSLFFFHVIACALKWNECNPTPTTQRWSGSATCGRSGWRRALHRINRRHSRFQTQDAQYL